MKNKLTIVAQIQKLKDKGIYFNIINEEDAQNILLDKTYLFKLFYFRKSFMKNIDGSYNVEFACLSDLASIDMEMRYTLLQLTLDIEHSLKVLLNKYLSMIPNEDGYNIIDQFIDKTNITKRDIFKYKMNKNEVYPEWEKFYQNTPYWVAFEIMSFYHFEKFVTFYYETSKNRIFKLASNQLVLVRNIRNSCAHNSVINVPLFDDTNVTAELNSYFSLHNIEVHFKQSKPFIDIATLLMIHNKYCNQSIKNRASSNLQRLLQRLSLNRDYYDSYNYIIKYIDSISKVINHYIEINTCE
ncbi:Abi family protein [Macrococcoides goetzii]|uniref:Abi family protein n=1 Tax=Macrococcoides goetzii TaxID=1891097 RepID=A0A395GAF4_9STAP|nr:Abi family protein [Macrococcus goetzii]RAI81031.1 Abi family protein [Macrococcus goetzii]